MWIMAFEPHDGLYASPELVVNSLLYIPAIIKGKDSRSKNISSSGAIYCGMFD